MALSRTLRGLRDVTIVLLVATATAVAARSIRIQPRSEEETTHYRLRPGSELVIVLIGSSACSIARDGDGQSAFRATIKMLRQQARDHQIERVSTVGVAVDWLPDSGLAFLRKITEFDEVIVGRSWLNTGLDRYVRASGGELAVPQVIVLRRSVAMSPNAVNELAISDEHILQTTVGLEPLLAWARAGAPVNWTP